MVDFYTLAQLPSFQPDRNQRFGDGGATSASAVTFPHVKRVDLTTSRTSVAVGAGVQLTWTVLGDDGSDITALVPTSALRFSASDPTKLAIDATGVVTGLAIGAATIAATVGDYAPTESGTTQSFTVTAGVPTATLIADWSPSVQGTDVINDLSGNGRVGHGGSASGTDAFDPTFSASAPAMRFTGGQYAQAPVPLTAGLACHAVLRALAGSTQQTMICADTGTDTQSGWEIDPTTGIRFTFTDATGAVFTLAFNTLIDVSRYYDVLAQYDTAIGGELWVDGVLRATCPPGVPLRTTWSNATTAAHMIFGGIAHLGTSSTPVSTDVGSIVGRMRLYAGTISATERQANSALFAALNYNGVHGATELPAFGTLTVDSISDTGARALWTEPATGLVDGDVTELWIKDPYQSNAWSLWWEQPASPAGGATTHTTPGLLPGTSYQIAGRTRRKAASGGFVYSDGAASVDPTSWPSVAAFATTGVARGTVAGTNFPHDVSAVLILTNTPGTLDLRGTLGDSIAAGDVVELWWRNTDDKTSVWQGPMDVTASVGSRDASDHTHFYHTFTNTLPQGTHVSFAARAKRAGYYAPASSEDWPPSWAPAAQLAGYTATTIATPPLMGAPIVVSNDTTGLTLRYALPGGIRAGDTLDVQWTRIVTSGPADTYHDKAIHAPTVGVAGSAQEFSWSTADVSPNDLIEVAVRVARPDGGGGFVYAPDANAAVMGRNTGDDPPGWAPFPHFQVRSPSATAHSFVIGGAVCPTITTTASAPTTVPVLTHNTELDVRLSLTIPYDRGPNDVCEVWARANDGAGTTGAWTQVGNQLWPNLPGGTFAFPSIAAFPAGDTRYEVAYRTARWQSLTPTYSTGATDTAHPESWPAAHLFFTTVPYVATVPPLPVDPWLRRIWVYGTNTYILRWAYTVPNDWVSAGANNDGFKGLWKKPSMASWDIDFAVSATTQFVPGQRYGTGVSGIIEYGTHTGAFQFFKNVAGTKVWTPSQAPPILPDSFPAGTVFSVLLIDPQTFVAPPPNFPVPADGVGSVIPTISAAGKPSISLSVINPSGTTDNRDAIEWWVQPAGGAWSLFKTSPVLQSGSTSTMTTATTGLADLPLSDGGVYRFNWRYQRDGNASVPRASNVTLYNYNADVTSGGTQLPDRWYPDFVTLAFHRSPPVFPAFTVTHTYTDGFEFTFTNPAVDGSLTDDAAIESSVIATIDRFEVWAKPSGGSWAKLFTSALLTGAGSSLAGVTHVIRATGFTSGQTYDVALRYFRSSASESYPAYRSTQRDETNPASWPAQTRATGLTTA